MPDLGYKLHVGRPKWIIVGDFNVDGIGSTFIGCSWRPWERASKMCKILPTVQWFSRDLRLCVGVDVGDLFGDTPCSIGRHRARSLVMGKLIWEEQAICVVFPLPNKQAK